MENGAKTETTSITKKQFARIHEKIQNKYEEMQRRLEKSKSIDMLNSVRSNFNYKHDRQYASVCDLDKVDDDFLLTSETNSNDKYFTNIKDTNKYNAVFQDVIVREAVITKSESLLSLTDKFDSDGEDSIENNISSKSLFKTSIESLTEAAKESDDSNEPQTPTSKSIRDRIGSRIKAVKNRRREEKEKRNKEKKDKVEKLILSNSTKLDFTKLEKKIKLATVTLALIDLDGFEEDPEEKPRALMCRFRLGAEKRKSKIIKSHQRIVKFQEIINFEQYDDDHVLEVVVWDKDISIGRTTIDLSTLEKEKTHKFRNNLEGDIKNIQVFMLLTITGSSLANTLYDIDEKKCKDMIEASKSEYVWYRLSGKFSKVGHLWVIVYGAKGLSANDCYCVLNLNNESVRTITDYKTNCPSWMKIFSFVVTDITSSLEVIVYDEKKSEEIGKLTLSLLDVESGKKKWYALKDVTQRQAAKGQNSRVLLEINVSWNFVKAAMRVINLKETNYLQSDDKLDRHLFARNLSRAKSVVSWVLNFLKIFKAIFQWESWKVNTTALVVWILFWTYGKVWMSPLLLLIPFVVYNYEKIAFFNNWQNSFDKLRSTESESESKDEKSVSLRQKINSWQEMIQVVQNSIGKFASIGESVKNLYNFSVPFVSYIAIFLTVLIAFVIYLIPVNYLLIVWGIHKYTQKIFNPNRIPHNEILDLISRVPDDEALVKQQVLPLEDLSDDDAS